MCQSNLSINFLFVSLFIQIKLNEYICFKHFLFDYLLINFYNEKKFQGKYHVHQKLTVQSNKIWTLLKIIVQ